MEKIIYTGLLAGAAFALIFLAVAALLLRSGASKRTKVIALFAIGLVPPAWCIAVVAYQFVAMQSVSFCLSCHTMKAHGESLTAPGKGDEISIVANHYLNNYIPRKRACYVCHADHTPVIGPIRTKIKGLGEAFIQYLGKPPAEMEIKMKEPFGNENCLHCHSQSAKFKKTHEDDLKDILSGKTRCMECHDVAHEFPKKGEENHE